MTCQFCASEIGGVGVLEGFNGSCPNCEIGDFPKNILVKLVRSDNGTHTFQPIGIVFCQTCRTPVKEITVYCEDAPINVTEEFASLKKGRE